MTRTSCIPRWLAGSLASIVLASGCVSAPPAQLPAPGSAAAAPAGSTTSAEKVVAQASDEGFKVPAGYTPKMLNGELRYCRSVTTVGTRLPKQYCFTQEQLEDVEKRSRSIQEDLARSRKTCSSAGGCSTG
jgi:hypothetical protein